MDVARESGQAIKEDVALFPTSETTRLCCGMFAIIVSMTLLSGRGGWKFNLLHYISVSPAHGAGMPPSLPKPWWKARSGYWCAVEGDKSAQLRQVDLLTCRKHICYPCLYTWMCVCRYVGCSAKKKKGRREAK